MITPLVEFHTPEDRTATVRVKPERFEHIDSKRLVIWRYRHHINSRSSLIRVKVGEYIGKRRHTRRHWSKIGAQQMAGVQFVDNKRMTFVPYDELEFVQSYEVQS